MIQGLPPSTVLYSLLLRDLDEKVTAIAPAVAITEELVLLDLYHKHATGGISVSCGYC